MFLFAFLLLLGCSSLHHEPLPKPKQINPLAPNRPTEPNAVGRCNLLISTLSRKGSISKLGISNNKGTLAYLAIIMLVHDTELNPGPRAPKYPCGYCGKAVTWKDMGVCCDRCEKWFHVDCQGISEKAYSYLGKTEVSWECLTCGLPNFSTAFLNSTSISVSNSFSTLQDTSARTPTSTAAPDLLSPGPPVASSSPKPTRDNTKKGRKAKQSIKILNVNAQSITNKKAEFQNIVNSTGADVVVVTETWLKEGIHQDGEIGEVGDFSSNYKIYRRDSQVGSRK